MVRNTSGWRVRSAIKISVRQCRSDVGVGSGSDAIDDATKTKGSGFSLPGVTDVTVELLAALVAVCDIDTGRGMRERAATRERRDSETDERMLEPRDTRDDETSSRPALCSSRLKRMIIPYRLYRVGAARSRSS